MENDPDGPDRRPTTVTWKDLEEAAPLIFDVWSGKPELKWAKMAWTILGEAGLTSYKDEVERHLVLMRFFALSWIYRDFCSAAWEENTECLYSDWAHELELSTFRLGQCVEHDFCSDWEAGEAEDEELAQMAVEDLVEQARPKVVRALRSGYSSTTELFVSLWLSDNSEFSGVPVQDLDRDLVSEILNNAALEAMEAYSWIDGGMYPYR
jgi:hypothetical protein